MEDRARENQVVPPLIRVRIEKGKADKKDFCFTKPFRIGRDNSCDVQVLDSTVSRLHAEIWFDRDRWWVHDLKSGNGTYVDGKRVERSPLAENTRIQLGRDGPTLFLTIEPIPKPDSAQTDHESVTHYVRHYFSESRDEKVGKRTMFIRQAFNQVQKRQKRKYTWAIGVVVCLFLVTAVYAVFKHIEVRKQKSLAQDIFYAMKSLELQSAGIIKAANRKKDPESIEYISTYRAKRKEMEQSYDKFIDSLKIYGEGISEQERTILHIARIFGECEINMPRSFVEEVFNYINKWKATPRLGNAIMRAKRKGYVFTIAENMLAYDLPPQFFYLALQESNFNQNACGPKTRFGIAKGIWQFIPSTASHYGLRTGPLVNLRRADPRDERHDFKKSTQAAARYLRDIYDTEAQASGMLVIASYNWGERRVVRLIRKMPENPKERNFWRILAQYKTKIPQETYDYVFYILSAAVIGENPRLFGLDFDNPLALAETRLSG